MDASGQEMCYLCGGGTGLCRGCRERFGITRESMLDPGTPAPEPEPDLPPITTTLAVGGARLNPPEDGMKWISNWCLSCGGSPEKSSSNSSVSGIWPTYTFICRRRCGVWKKTVEADDVLVFYENGIWVMYRADLPSLRLVRVRKRTLAERDALKAAGAVITCSMVPCLASQSSFRPPNIMV